MKGKLLLVDDEPFIRKGIAKLIENNVLGWSVVGEAENGEDALRQMRMLSPDLVVTDIRMPMMDGLELSKRIRESFPGTKAIILTGYRDFEYAQAALRYGVSEFLLKPCKEEELCRTLSSAYNEFLISVQQKTLERKEKQEGEHQLLRSLMLQLPYPVERNPALQSQLAGKDWWLVKVDTYLPSGKGYRQADQSLLQFAITNIVTEHLTEELGEEWIWLNVEHDSFAFMGASRQNDACLVKAAASVHQLLGITLTPKRMGDIAALSDLKEGYARFRIALPASVQNGTTSPYVVDEAKFRAVVGEISSFLQLGRTLELQRYLERVISVKSGTSASLEDCKMQAISLAMALNEVTNKQLEQRPSADIGFQIAELSTMDERRQIDRWLQNRVKLFDEILQEWVEGRNGRLVDKAIRYIELHYTNECSLADAANHVHLSPNYFSNVFKKETGETYTSYVTGFRMNKAKILLSNTDMKIAEIAQAVGYSDSNYFATAFKQTVGTPPSEFRKKGERFPE